jgi:hypothetical protein
MIREIVKKRIGILIKMEIKRVVFPVFPLFRFISAINNLYGYSIKNSKGIYPYYFY